MPPTGSIAFTSLMYVSGNQFEQKRCAHRFPAAGLSAPPSTEHRQHRFDAALLRVDLPSRSHARQNQSPVGTRLTP